MGIQEEDREVRIDLREGLDRADGYRVLAAEQADEPPLQRIARGRGIGRDRAAYPLDHPLGAANVWHDLRSRVYPDTRDVAVQLQVVVFEVP